MRWLIASFVVVAMATALASRDALAETDMLIQGCGESGWNSRENWAIDEARTNAWNDGYATCRKAGGYVVQGMSAPFQDPTTWFCQQKSDGGGFPTHKCSGCVSGTCRVK